MMHDPTNARAVQVKTLHRVFEPHRTSGNVDNLENTHPENGSLAGLLKDSYAEKSGAHVVNGFFHVDESMQG